LCFQITENRLFIGNIFERMGWYWLSLLKLPVVFSHLYVVGSTCR
jgi:hypothetical protein